MDEIRCAVEVRQDESGNRLIGVLLPFATQASDRPELFENGSLTWPAEGLVLRRQHRRDQPILKFIPIEADNQLRIDAPIPDTIAGRDAAEEIRTKLLTGLSIEFKSIRERFVGGIRRIARATLTGAGLVDSPAYAAATVEAREARAKAARERERGRELYL